MNTIFLPASLAAFSSFAKPPAGFVRSAIFLAVLFHFLPVSGQTLPPLQNSQKPYPAPAPPGLSFTLPVGGAPDSEAPACGEWTQTAGPNECLIITGSRFSTYSGINEGKDSRFVLYADNRLRDANIQRIDGDKAIITINKDVAAWDMYLLWPANEKGYGRPIAINKTDAWWVGPDKAVRGKTVSLYGRNLAHNNDTLLSYVYLKPRTGSGQWATVTSVNPYKVDFIVPANLANGEYEVWAHNGHGGDYGWSGPLTLTLADSVAWSSVVFNVKNFGAKGNGVTDDTQAITQAVAAAGPSPGATIYFPAGEYIVSNTLEVRSKVRWLGEGAHTVIKCSPDFSSDAWGVLYAQQATDFELKNLCFDGAHNVRGHLTCAVCFRGCDNFSLSNVQFRFQDFSILDLHSSRHVSINRCGFVGKQSFLGSCSQLFIDGCRFELTNDAEMALHSWGGECVSLTNSVCRDYDNSNPLNGDGWGMGRFFVGNGLYGSNRLTYLANNQTEDLTVRPLAADQNAGEQFMWEGNLTLWSGHCLSSTSAATTLNGFALADDAVRYAVIVKGKGFGQSRRIIGHSGTTIVLATPWNVVPDGESVINIGSYMDRVVVYGNYLDAKPYAATNLQHNASAGVEPFGGCFNLVADNNTFHQLRQGVSNWATRVTDDEGIAPNFFNLYANNRFSDCRWAIYNSEGNWSPKLSVTEGTGIAGTIYRNNRIENPTEAGIKNSIQSSDYPVMDAVVYEHNSFTNLATGFQSDTTGIVNQLFYHNTFSGGTEGASGYAVQTTARQNVRENTISGFDYPYWEAAGKPVIEAPNHVIELSARSGGARCQAGFTLWNSGTAVMQWQADASASWLRLSDASGVISQEGDSSRIVLTGDPGHLPPGTYKADLTVRCEGQRQVYQILFRVSEAGVSLPARLLFFGAKRSNGSVLLAWTAAGAQDDKGFDVERSDDEGRTFKKIGYMPPAGSNAGNQFYEFKDANSLPRKAYYRLKQWHADDGFTVSEIRTVNANAEPALSVYPNPTQGFVNLLLHPAQAGTVSLFFYDNAGLKVLRTLCYEVQEGSCLKTIDVSFLPKGLYVIKVLYPDKQEKTTAFVKG